MLGYWEACEVVVESTQGKGCKSSVRLVVLQRFGTWTKCGILVAGKRCGDGLCMSRPASNTVDNFPRNVMLASSGGGDARKCISIEDSSMVYAGFWLRSCWFG